MVNTRTNICSSEKEESHKCLSDEELVKDYLEQHSLFRETSKLCCCLETKNIYSELGTGKTLLIEYI